MKYKPRNRTELIKLVRNENINLGDIDTSDITDMRFLFCFSKRTEYSGIENWDVSNVKDMRYMFFFSGCKNDLSKWKINKYLKIDEYSLRKINNKNSFIST